MSNLREAIYPQVSMNVNINVTLGREMSNAGVASPGLNGNPLRRHLVENTRHLLRILQEREQAEAKEREQKEVQQESDAMEVDDQDLYLPNNALGLSFGDVELEATARSVIEEDNAATHGYRSPTAHWTPKSCFSDLSTPQLDSVPRSLLSLDSTPGPQTPLLLPAVEITTPVATEVDGDPLVHSLAHLDIDKTGTSQRRQRQAAPEKRRRRGTRGVLPYVKATKATGTSLRPRKKTNKGSSAMVRPNNQEWANWNNILDKVASSEDPNSLPVKVMADARVVLDNVLLWQREVPFETLGSTGLGETVGKLANIQITARSHAKIRELQELCASIFDGWASKFSSDNDHH